MTTEIWLLRWSYWDDNDGARYAHRDERYDDTANFGFFLTEFSAQAKADELNGANKVEYDRYLERLKADFAVATKEYERKLRADKEEEKKNKLLKAHGFATKPIPNRTAPHPEAVRTYEEFHRYGSWWEPFKVEYGAA